MCVACGCSKEYQKVTSGLRFHRSGLPILRDVAHASPIWATAPHSTLVKHGLLKVDLLRTHVLLRRLLASSVGVGLGGKRLELLKEAVPAISLVFALWHQTSPGLGESRREMEDA